MGTLDGFVRSGHGSKFLRLALKMLRPQVKLFMDMELRRSTAALRILADRARSIVRHREILAGLIFFIFYGTLLPLLQIVPYRFVAASSAASASAVAGYSNQAAYVLALLLCLLCLAVFWVGARLNVFGRNVPVARTDQAPQSLPPSSTRTRRLLEVAIVFVAFFLLYCPLFLSKSGPYNEDVYFLTVLHRLQAGQRPYIDFEFFYGPLMLYLAHGWNQVFGYSMRSYYSLIALMEGAKAALILAVLHLYVPLFRKRLATFLIIMAFLFNTLLGLNYDGIRQLLPVAIVVIVGVSPLDRARSVVAAFLLGAMLAYSHEFGVASVLAVGAMYTLLAVYHQRTGFAIRGFAIGLGAGFIWLSVTTLLLGGEGVSAYIRSCLYLIGRYNAGELGFPFRWTLNSLATFGLVLLACAVVGRGLGQLRRVQIASGDLLLFGGLVYWLVGSKSALTRADMWHLSPPMLVLVLAFVLPWPKLLFAYGPYARRLSLSLIVVMAVSYSAGLIPTGRAWAKGLLRGMRDWALSRGSDVPSNMFARGPSIEPERSYGLTGIPRLAGYLAEPVRSRRQVVFYGPLWSLDKHIGVYQQVYATTELLLSEEVGHRIRDFLERRPDALVLIDHSAYGRLFGSHPDETPQRRAYFGGDTTEKRILGWLSSIHFEAVQLEFQAQQARWDRTVGCFLRSHYERSAGFGAVIVLARKRTHSAQS